MSSASSVGLNVQGQTCCFWLQQAKGCDHATHIGIAITLALAIITMIGGILLVLAQQGYHLGPLNSLSHMIQAESLYIGIGVAGAILVLDITLICTLTRFYLNKTYSLEEVNQMNLQQHIQDNNLKPLKYSIHIIPATEHTPLVFALLAADHKGHSSLVAFKTSDDLTVHIERLKLNSYTQKKNNSFLLC